MANLTENTLYPWHSMKDTIETLQFGSYLTTIGSYAFTTFSKVSEISFNRFVTTINENAFSYCSSLTTVIIAGSLTFIGEDAFTECDSLLSMTYRGTNNVICEKNFISDLDFSVAVLNSFNGTTFCGYKTHISYERTCSNEKNRFMRTMGCL